MEEEELKDLKLKLIKWICTLEDEVILEQIKDILKGEKSG